MNFKYVRQFLNILVALLAIGAGTTFLLDSNDQQPRQIYQFSAAVSEESEYLILIEEGYTPALKAETVYVNLDYYGNVEDQVIVNRIYGGKDENAGLIADYGEYMNIENMVSAETPLIEDNRLLWNSDIVTDKALYYEGTLQKEPPVKVEIDYYLDGEKIKAEDLAGKDGHLVLTIRATNLLSYEGKINYYDYNGNLVTVEEINYVPFIVQGTFDLDLDRFSNIETEEGMEITTGSTSSINFMIFPYPEGEITISMDGKNIQLGKASIIASPGIPAFPEIDIEEDLLKLLDGISQLGEGIELLASGSDQLLMGLRLFEQESGRFTAGAEDLAEYIEAYLIFRKQINEAVSSADSQEILQMLEELEEIMQYLENMPDPTTVAGDIAAINNNSSDFSKQVKNLNSRIDNMLSSSHRISEEAERLIAENEPGSELHTLGLAILEQENELKKLADENRLLMQNLNELNRAVQNLNNSWENNFIPGLQGLEALNSYLSSRSLSIPEEIASFREGLDDFDIYLRELDSLILEAEGMLQDISELPSAVGELADGQSRLSSGLTELGESGILALEKGLIEGINESRYGAAKLDLMEKLADDYRSYADNDKNRYSKVQFIMQTAAIESEVNGTKTEENLTDQEEKHWSLELWARLIDLF